MTHIPLRMCIACRSMKPAPELIRFIAEKGSDIAELDLHKKKFGRGAYVCASMECIKKAEKKTLFGTALGLHERKGIIQAGGGMYI